MIPSTDELYTCMICGISFTEHFNLSAHRKHTHGESPFSCKVCDKYFPTLDRLKIHERVHSGVKPYSCNICDKSFSQNGTLIKHKLMHAGIKPFKCDICGKALAQLDNLYRHKRIHTGERPFPCSVCKKAFMDKTSLKRHFRLHTGEKPHSCEICGRAFTDYATLFRHRRQHTGEKPYSCKVCGKSFTHKGNYDRHEKDDHNKDSDHACNVCGRHFKSKGYLEEHLKIHTADSQFQCNFCDRSFELKRNLKAHIQRHIERPFKCDICGLSYANNEDLSAHKSKHKKVHKFTYYCIKCGMRFLSRSYKHRHYKNIVKIRNCFVNIERANVQQTDYDFLETGFYELRQDFTLDKDQLNFDCEENAANSETNQVNQQEIMSEEARSETIDVMNYQNHFENGSNTLGNEGIQNNCTLSASQNFKKCYVAVEKNYIDPKVNDDEDNDLSKCFQDSIACKIECKIDPDSEYFHVIKGTDVADLIDIESGINLLNNKNSDNIKIKNEISQFIINPYYTGLEESFQENISCKIECKIDPDSEYIHVIKETENEFVDLEDLENNDDFKHEITKFKINPFYTGSDFSEGVEKSNSFEAEKLYDFESGENFENVNNKMIQLRINPYYEDKYSE